MIVTESFLFFMIQAEFPVRLFPLLGQKNIFIPVCEVKWGESFCDNNHVHNIEVLAQNTKNHRIDSGPVPGCSSTRNSLQEITTSEDA